MREFSTRLPQSLTLLLPLPHKLLPHTMPTNFRLHHFSETAFKATNALLASKSKCLFLEPPLLLLTFLLLTHLDFSESLWLSLIIPENSPNVSDHSTFLLFNLSFLLSYYSLPTSPSSPTPFNTGILLGRNKLCSGIRLLGLDPNSTTDGQCKRAGCIKGLKLL